jgi:topoisomerase IV subunit B
VRDYGRGIPLGQGGRLRLAINTGAKYNDDVFQFSVGLNGVGTKAVNALSSRFLVRSHREGEFAEARSSAASCSREEGKPPTTSRTAPVEFTPDPEIFGEFAFREEHLAGACASTPTSTPAW